MTSLNCFCDHKSLQQVDVLLQPVDMSLQHIVISKVFELVILSRCETYLHTTANQFGFKSKHVTDIEIIYRIFY